MDLSPFRLLTVDEFCTLAKITRSRFDMERKAGRIRPVILGIRSIRVRFQDYLDWVSQAQSGLPCDASNAEVR